MEIPSKFLRILWLTTLLVVFASGLYYIIEKDATAQPNVVIIVADDMGWADVGYHNNRVDTPNIDSLAAAGIELDRFYVAPTCTPTRAGLLTGRYPIRFGMAGSALPPYGRFGLPESEFTTATAKLWLLYWRTQRDESDSSS